MKPPWKLSPDGTPALTRAHWLLLSLSAGVTLAGYYYSKRITEERTEARFKRQAEQVVELVVERMGKYEDALWGGVSAIRALGGNVSYPDWRTFASSMRIEEKYPGINGIGVIHAVNEANLDEYLATQRQTRPDFRIYPRHRKSEHWPISYIEPVAPNEQAVGLDIAHESNRLTAANRARDTGKAQITGPIVLVQDAKKTPGFLFYAPFYNGETNTVAERRSSIVGLVYAPFVVERLMEGTLERDQRHVAVRISDGVEPIYDEHGSADDAFDPQPLYTTTRTLNLYGRQWLFELRSDSTFRHAASNAQPLTILLGGAALDILLLFLFLGMVRRERDAISYSDRVTQELRTRQCELERGNATLREQSAAINAARCEAEDARAVAERAAATQAQFLATMSHELRTPMNGVIATAELLADAAPEERKQLTDVIIRSGQTLLALINDILDFSKLEAGKVELDPHPTDLRLLFRDVLQLLEPAREANAVALTFEISPEIPNHVLADGLRLRQVIMNLCSNAIKFAQGGQVRVSCIQEARIGARCAFTIAVEDNGIGIEDPSVLFKEFSQADASTTRKFGGTGLGLAICKRLVERMGGTIAVDSTLGLGSRFYFQLMLDATEVAPAPVDTPSDAAAHSIHRGHALIVDDNAVNRMVAQKLLARLGWQVSVATDGQQALDMATQREFDLIFMDCQMPVLDGYEATTRLRELRPDVAPIIALTANAMPSDQQRCLDAGMSDFLPKPVRAEALRVMISKWTASSHPSKA